MNEKLLRKPSDVKINPEALHKARVEALRSRKTLGEWLEEVIEERIEREQKKVKQKRPVGIGLSGGVKIMGLSSFIIKQILNISQATGLRDPECGGSLSPFWVIDNIQKSLIQTLYKLFFVF